MEHAHHPHEDIVYPSAIPFVLTHLVCFAAIWTGVSWQSVTVCFVLYFVRMFAITGGYHRYFSHRSYKTGGLTNTPARVAALKRMGLARSAYRFAVFSRDDQPCHVCATHIVRASAGSRRIYWCPSCQADPRAKDL